jgi:hypothetical protein
MAWFVDHTQRRITVGRTPSGRVISPTQRPLPDNTQHSQLTNSHTPGGIRTHNPSRRAAAGLRLRPRVHCDRHVKLKTDTFIVATYIRTKSYVKCSRKLTTRYPSAYVPSKSRTSEIWRQCPPPPQQAVRYIIYIECGNVRPLTLPCFCVRLSIELPIQGTVSWTCTGLAT